MAGLFNSALAARQREIVGAGAKYIAVYIILIAGPYIYLDTELPEADSAYSLLWLVGIGLSFALLYGLMRSSDAIGEDTNIRIGAFFWLSFVHLVAVSFAMVVFVLPGLYIALRWLPAFARVLQSDDGIMEALQWSWAKTSGRERDLAIPFLLVIAAYLLGIGPSLATELLYGSPEYVSYEMIESLTLPSVVFTNIVIAIASAFYTVLGVASYAWLGSDTNRVAAEFE